MPRPYPHHPHHDGPEWIVAAHTQDLSRAEYAAHLRSISDALATGPDLRIDGTTITVPDDLDFELLHEATPHGTFALLVRIEWPKESGVRAAPASARGLAITGADDARRLSS